MSAPHFFVEHVEEGLVTLDPDDARHALRSLRLRPGEAVTLADGRGGWGDGVLAGDIGRGATVEVRAVRRVQRPLPPVSVALAPPKGERLTWAVQKLAELGVDEVVLIGTERAVRTWDDAGATRARERLSHVAREAAMQSRRPFVTRVSVGSFDEALRGPSAIVVLHETAPIPMVAALPDEAPDARILVGPEGGFSEREVEAARAAGAEAVGLGRGILRTETAAVVGAALVLHRYGRLG